MCLSGMLTNVKRVGPVEELGKALYKSLALLLSFIVDKVMSLYCRIGDHTRLKIKRLFRGISRAKHGFWASFKKADIVDRLRYRFYVLYVTS